MSRSTSLIIEQETKFHDAWASSTSTEKIRVCAAFEAITAPENRFILSQMGDLKGKRLLDIGCGLGESSVYFALKGAQVTALDISPGMVKTTQDLGRTHGVVIEGLVGSIEGMSLPSGQFDFVYLGNILHHSFDREGLFRKIHETLRPGGRFFSWDPLAYNPVINIYRRMATQVRTPDERPLTAEDLRIARKYFPDTRHAEFWFLGLFLFLKYFLIDRIHPNADRYWKRILGETEETIPWFPWFQRIDNVLAKIPGVKWFGWNIVMWGRKDFPSREVSPRE